MISSICRRRTSRETVAATDGSICSMTRSRSEAGITGWGVEGSSRLGADVGKLGADAGKLGVNEDKLCVNEGRRSGGSSGRLPNFFIARAAASAVLSARRRHQRSPSQSGRGNAGVLIRALELEFRD